MLRDSPFGKGTLLLLLGRQAAFTANAMPSSPRFLRLLGGVPGDLCWLLLWLLLLSVFWGLHGVDDLSAGMSGWRLMWAGRPDRTAERDHGGTSGTPSRV